MILDPHGELSRTGDGERREEKKLPLKGTDASKTVVLTPLGVDYQIFAFIVVAKYDS